MSLSGIENRESRNNNQESSLDSRFLRESRIECQLTFEQYCRMTGITKMTGITRMTRITGMTEVNGTNRITGTTGMTTKDDLGD